MPESERKAFKDYFDRAAAKALAKQLAGVTHFDEKAFVRRATKGLADLEFAGRVRQFSDALAAGLPEDRRKALDILTKSLPEPLPDCEAVTDGWLQWPVGQFIADHGIEHFDASFEAMIALTQRFSSEFAVRPFVERYPERTFARLLALTDHESPHVRRWCSEGVRPRLPWGTKLRDLVADPSPIFPILEALRDDPEIYVRRSVANNLNDIAKDHPRRVVALAKRWAKGAGEDRMWTVRHGLRTLVKAGDSGALSVLGFGPPRDIDATLRIAPKRIALGENVTLAVELRSRSRRAQPLMIDYIVHFVRKDGSSNPKVFKWTQKTIGAGETMRLEKRHPMRTTSIRALYPGVHRVEIQVNGAAVAESKFSLAL